MPDRDNSAEIMLPGQIVLSWADLQRVASTAGAEAAARIREIIPTREEYRQMAADAAESSFDRRKDEIKTIAKDVADEVVERFLERIGADGEDDLKEVRKSLEWAATMRAVQQTALKQGILALTTLFIGGIVAAVVASWKTKGVG